MRPLDLVRDAGNMSQFTREFFPPDFGDWRSYLADMWTTVAIAIWGTVLAIVCAVPLGLMCASNMAPAWIVHPVRRAMDACRAINEMVFAMLFIVAVGLGPFAGALALWVHTTGVLAKLFAEAVEASDPRPADGVRATGARGIDEILYGVLPQVMPLWLSYALYRFEANVRSATVVGMVGAGGIGVSLYEAIRSFNYAQTAAIMLVIIVFVGVHRHGLRMAAQAHDLNAAAPVLRARPSSPNNARAASSSMPELSIVVTVTCGGRFSGTRRASRAWTCSALSRAACGQPRREHGRMRVDMDDVERRVAFERRMQVAARTVDDHGAAALEPCVDLDADAIAQLMARPLQSEQSQRRAHFELFDTEPHVVLAARLRGGARDVAVREQHARTGQPFAREREQRVLARARRTHHVDEAAVHRRAPNGRRAQSVNAAPGAGSTKRRGGVDGQRSELRHAFAPPGEHVRAIARVGERVAQGHMKTELVEDIGIAPAIEQLALARAQAGGAATLALLLARRRAQGREGPQRVRRERGDRLGAVRARRAQGHEIAKHRGFDRQLERRLLAGQFERLVQDIGGHHMRRTARRRDERAVPAITARRAAERRHGEPARGERGHRRRFEHGPRFRIAPEPAASRLPPVRLARRRVVERPAARRRHRAARETGIGPARLAHRSCST